MCGGVWRFGTQVTSRPAEDLGMTQRRAIRAGPEPPGEGIVRRQLTLLAEVAMSLNHHVTLDAMLADALPRVCGLLGAEAAWVFLVEPDGGFALAGAHDVLDALHAPNAMPLACGSCRCQRRLLAGELTGPVNMASCERLERVPRRQGGRAFHASVPLGPVEARLGVLNLVYHDERPFAAGELAALDLIAATFSTAIARALLHDRIERSARDAVLRLSSAAIAAAPLGVFAIDEVGTCQWAGPGCAEIIGVDADQMHGRPFLDIVHEDERDRVLDAWSAARREGTAFAAEFRLAGRERVRRVELRATPIAGLDGTVSGWGGSVEDITERLDSDAAQARWLEVLASTSDMVTTVDGTGRLVYANPAAREVLGLGPDAPLAEAPVRDVYSADSRHRTETEVMPYLRRHAIWRGDLTMRHPVRGEIPVSQVTTAHRDADGGLVCVSNVARDVSAELALQSELRAREARFSALVQNSAALVGVLGADGAITYAGPSVTRVLGYRPEDFVGCLPSEFVHPDDLEQVAGVLGDVFEHVGQLARTEVRVRRSDGSWCRLDVAAMNLFHEPSVAGIVVNGLDITERVAASEALEQSERRYRELFEDATEGIAVASVGGRPLAANPAAVRMLGYDSLEQLVAEVENVRDLYVEPTDRDRIVAALRERGVVEDVELAIVRRDGDHRWVSLSARVLHDPETNVELLRASLLDVTDRRRAQGELEAREAWLRALLRRSSDPVIVVSAHGEVTYATPAIEAVLGWTPEEALARGLGLVHPEDLARLGAAFDSVVSRPGATETVEYRARHADGSWRHLDAALTSLLDDPQVQGVVLNHRDVTDRITYEHDLAHQALHDTLTELPNRALLLDRLGQALERSESVMALVLDLADFKSVNESLGHQSGDAVLVQVARRLRDLAAEAIAVARLEGDEFALVYDGVTDQESAIGIAQSLLGALEAPVAVADHEIALGANIGVVCISGEHRGCAECVLRDAEVALYHAKEQGRSGIECFDQAMREQVVHRLMLSQQLRHAIAEGELRMLVQPVVELATGGIVGLEALAAWQHPERGLLRAGEFIELAEETGLIFSLFEWILAQAAQTARELGETYPGHAPLPIAVNLSPLQLSQEGLADVVSSVLAQAGVVGSLIAFEITESALMRDAETARANLDRLHALGMRLMVDDFGTGYSSLTYLRRFPVDTLKIDQSFIAGLGVNRDDTAIVESTIQLARSLDLDSIAEGIETPAQARLLLELGCEHGQGYHFARPMPVGDLAGWLARQPARRDQSRSGV